jgi:hypothetical protein
MRALAILTVLPLVLTAPALAQNAQSNQPQPTSPNSGAITGQPGSKSGPAVKSPSATTGSGVAGEGRNQDAAKVPGLPGSKSGPAVKPPSSSAPTPK